jgi:YcxB-like protein
MPEGAIQVHARPTRAQLVRARLRLYLRSATGIQWTLGGIVAPPLLWAIWQAMGTQPWPSSNDFIFVLGPAFAIGMLALATFGGLNHPRTRAYLRDGAEYALSEDTFAVRGAMGEARLRWDACTRAMELPELFLLRLGNELHLLPKADFAAGDVERVRALLRDRLGKRATVGEGSSRR